MSEEDISYLPAWKNAIVDLFSGKYGYGDIVSHEELDAAFRLVKPETGSFDEFESWKLKRLIDALACYLLEERNICLRNLQGRGYEVVRPADQTKFAMDHGIKKLRGELRKMGRRLTYLDRTGLTHEQARENADALARLAWLQQQARKSARIKFTDDSEQKKIA